MRTNRYLNTVAAAALCGMAMTSSVMAFDGDWDGSYGGSNEAEQKTLQLKIELLREKVKYVFVIFHENESFDHYFGTFPGANGLFEAPQGFIPANQTPSFTQRYLDTSLNVTTISPFLMPQSVVGAGKVIPVYPADEISVDHSHQGMANSLDVDPTTGIAANDRYAMDQEGLTTNASGAIVTSAGATPTSIMTLAGREKLQICQRSHFAVDLRLALQNGGGSMLCIHRVRVTVWSSNSDLIGASAISCWPMLDG